MDCDAISLNGTKDHIHCLFSLNTQKSIADIIKQVKGASSHFVNQQNNFIGKFAWQTGYAAFSVSDSLIGKVSLYIDKQKQHHESKTFEQEYEEFLELLNLKGING